MSCLTTREQEDEEASYTAIIIVCCFVVALLLIAAGAVLIILHQQREHKRKLELAAQIEKEEEAARKAKRKRRKARQKRRRKRKERKKKQRQRNVQGFMPNLDVKTALAEYLESQTYIQSNKTKEEADFLESIKTERFATTQPDDDVKTADARKEENFLKKLSLLNEQLATIDKEGSAKGTKNSSQEL
ncbi:hypothetical protein ANCDUO_14709 [Ancylostoma duodenale]|uniref:Uncharacterized protein n=1 Tax=Ancylostoma duodenale TaxID=51022 RepID=A0A0C2CFL9_9BILA|nr:hypothetical protein ANCDUO_14709 [Ancylostoma duodenale]